MTSKLQLTSPVTALPLVGTRMAALLAKVQIKTVSDLLYHFPSRYEDFSRRKKISELMVGDQVTIFGQFTNLAAVYTRFGRTLVKGTFADDSGKMEVTWFNQPYLLHQLKTGINYLLAGRVESYQGRLAFINPTAEPPASSRRANRLLPVYPETKGLTSRGLSRLIRLALQLTRGELANDYLPLEIRARLRFPDLYPALNFIHAPPGARAAVPARSRFAFEELFFLHLRSLRRKVQWQKKKALVQITNPSNLVQPFLKSLPFQLTDSQTTALGEILTDLGKNQPMNRLLQGDVGSGKTVVAAAAIFAIHQSGYRSIYMAPTEILAGQHQSTLQQFLHPHGLTVGLVSGAAKNQGSGADLLVGTHALLYRRLPKEKVGLLIIDEQHRFGVAQRGRLLARLEKETSPHLLTMTATPIPRTLALTFYGDLDLSLITEMPPGRRPVKTWIVPPEKREAAYDWIKRQLGQAPPTGGQAFIVCPFIEESEVETFKSVKAAAKEFENLKKTFTGYRLGLLHGRLKSQEKEVVMQNFRQKKIDILVTTPVVEVGVDIPNATVIVIEGANHFGLASLHQLRGRVGRGQKQAYCLLFSDSDEPKTIQRLKALEKYHSGQKLAELDLQRRGMGELFGTAQHGFPELKVATFTDLELIKKTGAAAREIIRQGLDKYPALRDKILVLTTDAVKPN